MFSKRLFIASLCLLGCVAFSPVHAEESAPAGFAPTTIWLSQTNLIAGDEVRISTVLYNSSKFAIDGIFVFTIDGTTINTSPFALDANASSIKSTSWKTVEGSHQISASITSSIDRQSKNSISVAQATTTTIDVTIAPAPPKTGLLQVIDVAQNTITASTPVVQNFINRATTVTENTRTSGASYFSSIATNTARLEGEVLGTSTERVSSPTSPLINGAARAVAPIFMYPALFYPIFFIILMFLLWLIAKKLKGSNSKKY